MTTETTERTYKVPATLAVICLLAFMAGCPAPSFPLLATGATVMIGADDGRKISAEIVGLPKGTREDVDLGSGCRAVVVHDEAAEPPVDPRLRIVRLRLDDGPKKGLEVKVARYLVKSSP